MWPRREELIVRAGLIAALLCMVAGCDDPRGPHGRSGQKGAKAAAANAAFSFPTSQEPQAGKDPEYGQALYAQTCVTCHGAKGQGVPRQGVSLRGSKFLAEHNDDQVLDFLREGRKPEDAATLSGLLMPPRGGNQALDDTSLGNIVAFLRKVQVEPPDDDDATLEAEPNIGSTTQPVAVIPR